MGSTAAAAVIPAHLHIDTEFSSIDSRIALIRTVTVKAFVRARQPQRRAAGWVFIVCSGVDLAIMYRRAAMISGASKAQNRHRRADWSQCHP